MKPSMSAPFLSVCIPAYNADRYLAATLASVHGQTFTDWELIVIEDGSRDKTENIVEAFAQQGPQRVRFLRQEKNRGLSATRNTGFAQAKTELLAILDADDLWRPEHLELSVAALASAKADLVFGGCRLFDSDSGTPLEERSPPAGAMSEFPLSLYDGRVVIQPSTVVMRRAVITRCGGFNSQFPICNDLEFWFRTAKNGCHFAYTGAVTCDYRKHSMALSKRGAALVAERAEIYSLHNDWALVPAKQRRREMWRHHRDAARMMFRRDPLRSLGFLWRGNLSRFMG